MTKNTGAAEPAATPGRLIRTDFSAGEAAMAMVWLTLGVIFSLLFEVVYLDSYLTIPGAGEIPFPFTVVIAFFFNYVLTRTAMLWARNDLSPLISFIPVGVWGIGFFAVLIGGSMAGHQFMPSNLLPFLLLFAGIGGGMWPILRGK